MGKEKGILTVSKLERELRRPRSTINYNGSVRSEGDGLGKLDGTRSVSLGRVHHPHFETEEEKQPGSSQVLGSDLGSGLDLDSSRELGGPLSWLPGLGLDYWVALCPVAPI